MRAIVDASTDGATLTVYDPEALPQDFDERFAVSEPGLLMEEVDAAGACALLETAGDGEHIIHLYIDEVPAEGTVRHAECSVYEGVLRFPSGKLYCDGAEYTGRDRRGMDDMAPGPADLTLPPGDYSARFILMNYPPSYVRSCMRAGLSLTERFTLRVLESAMVAGFMLPLLGFIYIFASSRGWPYKIGILLASFLFLWLAMLAMNHLPLYARAADKRDRIKQSKLPDIVGVLERVVE